MVTCGGISRVLFFLSVDCEEGAAFCLGSGSERLNLEGWANGERPGKGPGMTLASLPRRSGQAEGSCEASDLLGLSIPFAPVVGVQHSLPGGA